MAHILTAQYVIHFMNISTIKKQAAYGLSVFIPHATVSQMNITNFCAKESECSVLAE
jgi:hypothetical protein